MTLKLYDVIRREQGEPVEEIPVTPPPRHRPMSGQKFSWKKISIIVAVLISIAALFIGGARMVRAKVIVSERRIPFAVNDLSLELVYQKEGSSGRLAFQTMVVTTEVTGEVFGSELKASNTKAKGKVVFFNEYSKGKQTVRSGITITAPNGKKYITQEKVTVPGYTIDAAKKKVPGTSPSVPVIAVDVGPTYNTTGSSFTVAGFPAKQFYAQSAGSIAGGEAGMKHTLTADERTKAIAILQTRLIEKLKRETRTQIPDKLITFPELQFTAIDVDSLTFEGESVHFPASMKGSMVSYLISRDILEQTIANKITQVKYRDVSIPTLGDISIEPISAIPTDPNKPADSLTVRISGQGTIIAKAPIEQIKESLIGKPKKEFANSLMNIPEIDTARFTLMPFWAPYFPAREDRITVIGQ